MFRLLRKFVCACQLEGVAISDNSLPRNSRFITPHSPLHRALTATLLFALPLFTAAEEAVSARLEPATVAARGKQSALLTTYAFGRYAVTVSSAQGVALQALDRMAGAGAMDGVAGKQDGRLDLFLDRGECKILTRAAANGTGKATLSAHAFAELNSRPSLLVEQRLERTTLGDFEQRSYWLEIKQKRTVAIEAAGRHLADLRLWRDGTWLLERAPVMSKSLARADHPLAVARFTAELEPGLYLVSIYGGPSEAWTDASEEKPLLVRFGIPEFGPSLRQQFTMSEFGVERFIVPENANFFRLELPVAGTANLQVGAYNSANPLQANGQSASIDKRSLPPVAEISNFGGSGSRLVTVSMEAGKSFVLQYFSATSHLSFFADGNYWISSIHAGHAEDSVGASAILTRRPYSAPEEYVDAQVLELKSGATWRRRFNLLDELTLFVRLPDNIKLRVLGQGVKARYRFEPFVTSRPRDYKTPPAQESGSLFDLDRGLYVLTVTPESKGILDLQLLPPESMLGKALSLVGQDAADGAFSPVSPVARFPAIKLDGTNHTVYLNRQPGVTSGIVLRPLPIDLKASLPVTQRAGEKLSIPVLVSEPGTLKAVAEDGHLIELALDNGKRGTELAVVAGRYSVSIKESAALQNYSLLLEPLRLSSKTPLPALPDAALAGLPKFPAITPGTPNYLELARNSAREFTVQVKKPGLYQFETSGLLHTAGKVRTRTNPSLFEQAENGVGHNFIIQNYLREGDYQLSVATQGQTEGDLGVQVMRTEVVDGGELRAGEVARALLPSAQALAYHFRISTRGLYHLRAMGQGRNFRLRLEDDNGWPVFAPELDGDISEELLPGDYRLIVLPQTADARVLTRLDKVAGQKSYKGHGPHRIALESGVAHTWLEAAKGKPRTPDQWDFDLPAPADLSIALDNEMEATLFSVADLKTPLATVAAQRGWSGRIAAGSYRLLARHSRNNNHVAYTLHIASAQLLAGMAREVVAPAEIAVSVGSDGLVELQSFGSDDVRARLLDASGEQIAQSDDRADDWNFHIARRLAPGTYRLLVDPVNERQAATRVIMHAPAEVAEKTLVLGSETEINDDRVHVYPLLVAPGHNVLQASAQSADSVGLALEGATAQGWVSLGSTLDKNPFLVLPLGAQRHASYRLRAWSADRRSLKVRVRANAAAITATPESKWLQSGAALARVDAARGEVQVAQIALERPGTFRLKGDLAQLQWSDGALCAQPVGNNAVLGVGGKTLWLVSAQRAAGQTAAAERLSLPAGDNESLRLELAAGGRGVIDLLPNALGPSLLLAQSGSGQPGIGGAANNLGAQGVVAGGAVAVVMPGNSGAVYVWNAGAPGSPLELDVRQVSLQRAANAEFEIGVRDGTLAAKTALPVKLPGGLLRVGLALSAQNAAVFVKRGNIVSTHWAGADNLHEVVTTDADEMWLLNAESRGAFYGIEIAQGVEAVAAALKPGELLEHNASTAGRLRVPVEVPKNGGGKYRLSVNGNARVLWQENSGRVVGGNDIALNDSGVLWLQHPPGILVAWLEAPAQQAAASGFAEWYKALRETSVKPPQTVSLSGKSQVLNLQMERTTLLHLRTSVPVVTHLLANGRAPQTEAHLQGANVNLLLPPGASKLVLRAVGADNLSGVATVMASEASVLREGAGAEVLLAPGSARLFTFEFKQSAPVGIGIRASSDIVSSVLYDARGTVRAEGVVQMPNLVPGRYYLSIATPPDSAPVLVQPVIFGLDQPDTRPPYNMLRRFVEGHDDEAMISFALAEEPPPPPAPEEPGESPSGEEDGEYQPDPAEEEPVPEDES